MPKGIQSKNIWVWSLFPYYSNFTFCQVYICTNISAQIYTWWALSHEPIPSVAPSWLLRAGPNRYICRTTWDCSNGWKLQPKLILCLSQTFCLVCSLKQPSAIWMATSRLHLLQGRVSGRSWLLYLGSSACQVFWPASVWTSERFNE